MARSSSLRDIGFQRLSLPGWWKRFAAKHTLAGCSHKGLWALNYTTWRPSLDSLGRIVPYVERALERPLSSALFEYYDSSQKMKVKQSPVWPTNYEALVLVRLGRFSGRPVGLWRETPLAVKERDFVQFQGMDDAAVVLRRDECERDASVRVGCARLGGDKLYARTLLLYLFVR